MKTAIWAIISFIIVTFASSIPGVRTARPSNSTIVEKLWFYIRKHKKSISIIGGMVGAIAACQASFEQDSAQELIVHKSNTIDSLNRKILEVQKSTFNESIKHYEELLGRAIEQRDKTTILLEEGEKLNKKTEEVAYLQKLLRNKSEYIQQSILGTGSYCYIVLMPMVKDHAELALFIEGQVPIYDLTIRITNLGINSSVIESGKEGQLSIDQYNQLNELVYKKNIESLAPSPLNILHQIGIIPFSYPKDSTLHITFTSRNGHWDQSIHHKIVNNQLIGTAKVTKLEPNKNNQLIKRYGSWSRMHVKVLKPDFDAWDIITPSRTNMGNKKFRFNLSPYIKESSND